jgi:hypothetical protein
MVFFVKISGFLVVNLTFKSLSIAKRYEYPIFNAVFNLNNDAPLSFPMLTGKAKIM